MLKGNDMEKKEKSKRFRHEQKYIITYAEKDALIRQFVPVIKRDANGSEKGYTIRSLYFDDVWETAYEEKIAGTFERKKYRIRIYNYSDKVIKLECKEKQGNYIHKTSAGLSIAEFEWIIQGKYDFLLQRQENLCREFYFQCMSKRMRPVVIVDYEREAFVVETGDVRITFDTHVRSGWMSYDIFDKAVPTYEVMKQDELIMEVKFTEMLPEYVRRLVVPRAGQQMAASKYTMCAEKKWEMIGL